MVGHDVLLKATSRPRHKNVLEPLHQADQFVLSNGALCSFYHLKFRTWPFSTAVRHHEGYINAQIISHTCKRRLRILYLPNGKWIEAKSRVANQIFSTMPCRLPPKKTGFNRKSQVDIKLGESFYYLPYLGICKSQNVLVNMYCNFTNELLCLSKLIYPSKMNCLQFWQWSRSILQ